MKNKISKNFSLEFKNIILISEAVVMLALIVSYIMSLFVIELKMLWQIYLVILTVFMSISNYTINKNIKHSILYIIIGLIFLIGLVFGA